MTSWQYETASDEFILNDHYYALHDTTAQEVGGYRLKLSEYASRFAHPDEAHKVREAIQAGIETTDPDFQFGSESRMMTAKGNTKWVTIWFCVEKNPEGKTVSIHGVTQDISARKLGQEALKKSETKYKMLHETMRDCFVQVDMSGLIVDANKPYLEMLGYTQEELYKLTYLDLTPAKWHKLESVIVETQILPMGYSDVYEKEYVKKDGTVFPVEVRTLLLKDEKGEPTGMWAIIRDITLRRLIETAMRESEERYRTLFNLESDAIFLIDNETGKILEANNAATLMYEYSHSELLSLKNSDLSTEPEATRIVTRGDVTNTNKRVIIPMRIQRKKNGDKFPGEISLHFFEYQGRAIHIAAIRDITVSQNALKKLKLSEETYRGIINSVNEAIYIQDEQGKFLDVNIAVEKMYGYKRDYFLGKTLEFMAAPGKNDLEAIKKIIKDAYKGTPKTLEFWGITKDGKHFPQEVSLSAGKYFGKKAIIAVARDISERKQAEILIREKNEALNNVNEALNNLNKKLEENEVILKESQKIAGLGSYRTDFKRGYWTSSEILNAIFGIENNIESSVEDWVNLIHPDWREIMTEYLNKLILEKNDRFDKEYKIIRKTDGKETWVHGLGELTFDKDGTACSMIGTIQDITRQKEAEEALQESRDKLTALIENTNDLIWALDENYCLIICNQQFLRQVKKYYNRDINLGETLLFEILPKKEHNEWRSLYKRALNGEIFTIEKEHSQSISITFFNYGFYPISNDEGKITGVVVSGRDITDRRKLESQMLQTDRMSNLGEMAAGIAHEINQPLNNISLTIDNILFDIKEKQFVDRAYIEKKSQRLFENILRMRNLIDHIRLFARSHEDKFHASFNVNEGIKNTLSMISEQLMNLEIRLIVHLDKNIPEINGSIYKFEQVILNLLLNAKDGLEEMKKSTPEPYKMQITITTKLQKENIIVEVEDNGAGIDSDKLDQIFLPFFSTKDEGKGTGLGLSISFGIIKQMNGNIEIQSKKFHSTKVTITLHKSSVIPKITTPT